MKRKLQKESTRARMLSAARSCFADRDVRDVSMLEIARRAGVSVGALYVHFDDREALIDAIVSELQDVVVTSIKTLLVSIDDPSVTLAIGRLSAVFVQTLDGLRPYVSLYASHSARTTAVEVLRTSGAAAPLVQMLNATLGSLLVAKVRIDVPFLAASLASVWRAAALSQTVRPVADAPTIASALAEVTTAILERGCPDLLVQDARQVARVMAQFLK